MTGHEPAALDDAPPAAERSLSWRSTLIPAAALVIGLVIGLVVAGVAGGDSDDGDASTPNAQPTDITTGGAAAEPSTPATIIVVPDECLAAADTVEQVIDLVRQGAAAIRDFESAELRSLLGELETLDAQARRQVEACRDVRTSESSSTESPSTESPSTESPSTESPSTESPSTE